MTSEQSQTDLRELIRQKLTALVREMESAGWAEEDVVRAIETEIASQWLPRFRALRDARAAQPSDFISDGNEG